MNIYRIFLFGFIITTHMFCDGVSALVYGRSQVGFAEKVNAYVQRVRSGSSGKEGVGEVLGRAMLLTPYSSMRSVTAILNHLGPFLIKDKDTAANEACCASLVKIVVPVVEQFDQELFDNLYTIDRCLGYWEYQRLHPVSYFFHKSPLKYFTLGQQEEVADKIQFLRGEQQHHFALLGKINIHLSSFDADRSVDEQYAWIQQLCRVLFSYDVTSSISPDAELFPLLYESTNLVENYSIHMSDRLSNYHVPRVVMRRWLEGITAIAAVAYGAQKLYKNKDQLKGKTKTAYGTVRDEGRKMRDHYKAALFGDPEEERQLLICYKDAVRELNRIKREMTEDARKGSPFNELWRDLPEDPDSITGVDKVLAARMVRFAATKAPDVMGRVGRSMDEAREYLREEPTVRNLGNAIGLYNAARRLLGGFADVGSDAKAISGVGLLNWELLKKENRVMRAILYSAPLLAAVGAVAFGTYKLYKKIRGVPNYDPLRVDLVDMALLLNVYGDAQPADMDACDFGKLVYLAHKLQREEGRVPKQHRNGFMNEVSLLQRSSLTAGQKMRVIDLMYKKYTFLAQQGAGA